MAPLDESQLWRLPPDRKARQELLFHSLVLAASVASEEGRNWKGVIGTIDPDSLLFGVCQFVYPGDVCK